MEYLIFILVLYIIYKLNPFTILDNPYKKSCPICKEGSMIVQDYGSFDQFTKTIQPCNSCGYIEDKYRGC